MKKLSDLEHNKDSIEWLLNSINNQESIVWCGFGVSFSFAQLLAESLRYSGIMSLAVKPNEIEQNPNYKNAYISQSARKIDVEVDLILTQTNRIISWTKVQSSRLG